MSVRNTHHRVGTVRPVRRGVARAEVLVLMVAIAMLVAIAGQLREVFESPSLAAKCVNNLREIGRISAFVASSDAKLIPHRQSTAGLFAWRGLGQFDWGGADGMSGEFGPNCTLGAGNCLLASTRPFNAFVSAAQYSDLFRCPSDVGSFQVPTGNYAPSSAQGGVGLFRKSIYLASGNSYSGDFIWLQTAGAPSASRRFGSFLRPIQRFVNPHDTLLFYETRFAQAYLSSSESIAGGGGFGQPVEVQSWHGRQAHNALMADGHTQSIELRMTGSMTPTDSFPIDFYPDRTVMYRGANWRYDTFPEQPIFEHGAGDPIPPNAASVPSIQTRPQPIQPPLSP